MNNFNAPVLDRTAANDCRCFADVPPLPMGCAECGHAPYAHGCPGRPSDHEYAQPTGALMAMRLEARRTGTRPFPLVERPVTTAPAEVIPLVPAPRHSTSPASIPDAPAAPAPPPMRTPHPTPRPTVRPAAAPPRRDDARVARRPAPRPVESGQDRATRLALARDPLARRRARIAARAPEHSTPPPTMSQPPTRPPLTLLPAPPDHQHQTSWPNPALTSGQVRYFPNAPAPSPHEPSCHEPSCHERRQQVAA
ncbi:hypothetical protein ABT352_04145 [Streptosporangium sp. NPDC000563]|uniref:hypothetical protein n=1 Tax=Streptosporangium sp. NPDC000563 TaxID=3154366 RepID=UPI00331CCBE1